MVFLNRCRANIYVSPITSYSDYRDLRHELRRQSRVSGDQVLVSLDLLLPVEGGWPNSPVYLSETYQVEKLREAGIHLGQLSDKYILKYLKYIKT